MRFCEAEYNAPSVVSHHDNPASEPSVFWSAGCPSFSRCCESHCARLANAKKNTKRKTKAPEREKTTVTLTANATPLPNRKPPRCRLEGNISKVPFLINRIEIKI